MSLLVGCTTTKQINKTEIKAALLTLPTMPERRIKNVDVSSWQGLNEYITYQDNYISDLEKYCLSCKKLVDILNRNLAAETVKK